MGTRGLRRKRDGTLDVSYATWRRSRQLVHAGSTAMSQLAGGNMRACWRASLAHEEHRPCSDAMPCDSEHGSCSQPQIAHVDGFGSSVIGQGTQMVLSSPACCMRCARPVRFSSRARRATMCMFARSQPSFVVVVRHEALGGPTGSRSQFVQQCA